MSKFISGILGHAIGDAMGVPLEFSTREECIEESVINMIGYGAHDVPKGTWSDDTSMELAIMDSFIQKNQFDYDDIMQKFNEYVNEDKYTPNCKMFDIGRTVLRALLDYNNRLTTATNSTMNTEIDNGNGTLMRIFPVVYYAYFNKLNDEQVQVLIDKHSGMTHNHNISKMACYIYTSYLIEILNEKSINEAYKNIREKDYSIYGEVTISKFDRIINNDIYSNSLEEIKSTSFVVDTLEAVLWVIHNTINYKQAIIGAINLGGDTDTIGAITGSIAGVLYGRDNIPDDWCEDLIMKDYIVDMAKKYENKLKDL